MGPRLTPIVKQKRPQVNTLARKSWGDWGVGVMARHNIPYYRLGDTQASSAVSKLLQGLL